MIIEDKSAERSALNEDFDIAIPFSLRLGHGEVEPEVTVYPSLAKLAREFLAEFGGSAERLFSPEAIKSARSAFAPFLIENGFTPDLEVDDFFIDYRIDKADPSLIMDSTRLTDGSEELEDLVGYDLAAMNEFGHICFITELGGRIVSAACTNSPVYDDEEGGIEIGVETAPEYQSRGYGASNCAALAAYLAERGRYALYESESRNAPSLKLAAKLGGKELSRSFCIVGAKEQIAN